MSSPVFNYLHFVLSSPVDEHVMIKQLSIKTAKERNNEIPIIVSKMYSAALTKRCNNELIKRKKLRKDNRRIQSLYEKCPNTIFFLLRIFLYSVRTQETTDQKKDRIWSLSTQWIICQISSDAYGQTPRGMRVYIACGVLDLLAIDNSAHISH